MTSCRRSIPGQIRKNAASPSTPPSTTRWRLPLDQPRVSPSSVSAMVSGSPAAATNTSRSQGVVGARQRSFDAREGGQCSGGQGPGEAAKHREGLAGQQVDGRKAHRDGPRWREVGSSV